MHSYNDPAKQRSREMLREFIRKHLKFRKPKEIKVACFPGAEVEGEEALEVKEVYDQLGIPRENITGLEYNHENAERLRKAELGIQVVETDALSYFTETTKKFDVVSLDYCGQQTEDEIETLQRIMERRVLANNSVVATLYAGKRESRSVQLFMGSAMTPGMLRELKVLATDDPESEVEARQQAWEKLYTTHIEEAVEAVGKKSLDLKTARDGITMNNLGCLLGCTGFSLFTEKGILVSKDVTPECVVKETGLRRLCVVNKVIDERLIRTAANYIAIALCVRLEDRMGLGGIERAQYTSNKNYLMLMDLFFIKRRSVVQSIIDKIVLYYPEKRVFRWNPYNLNAVSLFNQLFKLMDEVDLAWKDEVFNIDVDFTLPDRVDLGSSWDASKKRRRISKRDALDLLSSGVPADEIVEAYGGFTLRQLAAFKAHLTMGTYEK